MFEKAKTNLDEILEITNKCPEKFQVSCFEILLDSLLYGEILTTPLTFQAPPPQIEIPKINNNFFEQHSISEEKWKKVFHQDGTKYPIIVGDLKEKTAAKKLVRLALLLGIKSFLETGAFNILRDTLVELCQSYSCYDPGNFAGIMKRQKNFFLTKAKEGWSLTVPGQNQAVEIIQELSQ